MNIWSFFACEHISEESGKIPDSLWGFLKVEDPQVGC